MYQIKRELFVPISLEEGWAFLNNPRSLEKITPPEYACRAVEGISGKMAEGLLVKYKMKTPILGDTLWISEIQNVKPMRSFEDVQRKGPYKSWRHLHEVLEVEGGVLFRDRVTYEMPFWIFGRIAHKIFARKMINSLFDYRESVMPGLFPAKLA